MIPENFRNQFKLRACYDCLYQYISWHILSTGKKKMQPFYQNAALTQKKRSIFYGQHVSRHPGTQMKSVQESMQPSNKRENFDRLLYSPICAFTNLLQFLKAVDATRSPRGRLLEIQLPRSGNSHPPPLLQLLKRFISENPWQKRCSRIND